jgi:hypothetical protein
MFYLAQLAQLEIPGVSDSTFKILVDAGAVVIVAIVLFLVALVFLLIARGQNQRQSKDATLSNTLGEGLVTAYKESAEMNRATADAMRLNTASLEKLTKNIWGLTDSQQSIVTGQGIVIEEITKTGVEIGNLKSLTDTASKRSNEDHVQTRKVVVDGVHREMASLINETRTLSEAVRHTITLIESGQIGDATATAIVGHVFKRIDDLETRMLEVLNKEIQPHEVPSSSNAVIEFPPVHAADSGTDGGSTRASGNGIT